ARLAGATLGQAAAAAGVSEATGGRWVAESGGMVPDLAEPCGRYLSLTEREEIAIFWAQGMAKAEIARRIDRHPATVGRELRRNQVAHHRSQVRLGPVPAGTRRGRIRPEHQRLRYRAVLAQSKAEERARRPKPGKLGANPALHAEVVQRLSKRWSPEQITRSLRTDFADRPEMWVSHETIYQALYVQGRGELRRELTQCLRTGRAIRRPRSIPGERRGKRAIDENLKISHRPAEVTDRAVPGHWEGDRAT
ncbi:MAG: IS30 family transposase, partial [Acidimicrobiales bacterium]